MKIKILTALVLTSSLLFNLSAKALTKEACFDEWKVSEASRSCDNTYMEIKGDQCHIITYCGNSNRGNSNVYNSGYFDLHQMSELSNCEGQLKVGSCGTEEAVDEDQSSSEEGATGEYESKYNLDSSPR